uniref:(northern house mosquito) hypothetical protein n=1 Tax=Culex pipiens TaxID=7175 RepID=A0A8D8B747_CULPI
MMDDYSYALLPPGPLGPLVPSLAFSEQLVLASAWPGRLVSTVQVELPVSRARCLLHRLLLRPPLRQFLLLRTARCLWVVQHYQDGHLPPLLPPRCLAPFRTLASPPSKLRSLNPTRMHSFWYN